MPVLRTAVLEIAYADHGDEAAPAVIVVHGWPDAARGWTPVVDALVAAGLRVLVPDLRGAGDTRFTHAETVRDGTAVALAQDVVDLADGLGLDRFAVVGHDWGGAPSGAGACGVGQEQTPTADWHVATIDIEG